MSFFGKWCQKTSRAKGKWNRREVVSKGVLSSTHLGNWSLCPWGTLQSVCKRCLEFNQSKWGSWVLTDHIPSVTVYVCCSSTSRLRGTWYAPCAFWSKSNLVVRCEPFTSSLWFIAVCFVAFITSIFLSFPLRQNALPQSQQFNHCIDNSTPSEQPSASDTYKEIASNKAP